MMKNTLCDCSFEYEKTFARIFLMAIIVAVSSIFYTTIKGNTA
jgi:hypothetical protein